MHHGVVYANVTAERKSDIEMLFMAHKNTGMDIGLEPEVNKRGLSASHRDDGIYAISNRGVLLLRGS